MTENVLYRIEQERARFLCETGKEPTKIYVSDGIFEQLMASYGLWEARPVLEERTADGWAPMGIYLGGRRVIRVYAPNYVGVGF